MKKNYVAIATVFIKDSGKAIFEQVMAKGPGLAKLADGYIDFRVLYPSNQAGPYLLFSIWTSKEKLTNFNKSEAGVALQNETKVLAEFIERPSLFEEYECAAD